MGLHSIYVGQLLLDQEYNDCHALLQIDICSWCMLANQTNVALPCSYPQPSSSGQAPCPNIFIKAIEFQEENIF
jgi:hypothetical protein